MLRERNSPSKFGKVFEAHLQAVGAAVYREAQTLIELLADLPPLRGLGRVLGA